MDYVTDGLIQRTLKESPAFKDTTIIVIAHRIKTVLDSDVIVVFSDGRLVEQGRPADLLANPNSAFALWSRRQGWSLMGISGRSA